MIFHLNKKHSNLKRRKIRRATVVQFFYILLIIILVNYIASYFFMRFDLTSEKRYTLSDKTVELAENLEDIVFIRIYLEGEELPYSFKRLRTAVKEMLDELKVHAGDNIEYEFDNPSSGVDKKTRNEIYRQLYNKGLQPTNLQERDAEGGVSQKIIFPGAIISYRDRELAVNLLKGGPYSPEQAINNSIQDIEYEISGAIRRLRTIDYQKIGFIEGHGELDKYQTGSITTDLSQYYYVDRIRLSGHLNNIYEIKGYACLIIAKPDSAFSEQDKFIIDQYIMNGGKVLWLLDFIQADIDSLRYANSTLGIYNPLNMDDQLFRYGARINPYLVLDSRCAKVPVPGQMVGSQEKYSPASWYYYPVLIPATNHPVTKNLDAIKLEFPGSIDTVGENPEVIKTFLLRSSQYSKVVVTPARISLDVVRDEPDPRIFNKSYQPVAVLLEGEFESDFMNRSPELLKRIEEIEGLKFRAKSKPTKMIVVADGDIIRNHVTVAGDKKYPQPLGQDIWYPEIYFEGNKQFILNAVNYLCDDSGLMEIRSRELKLRLLDKVRIKDERLKWQLINIIAPLVFIVLFGLLVSYWRKRRYAK